MCKSCFMNTPSGRRKAHQYVFVSVWNFMLHTAITELDCPAGIESEHQAGAWNSTLSDHRNLRADK